MVDDIAAHGAEAAHSGVVSLRRELWRKHVQLREIEPDDVRHDGAATEVLDLTARLLAAEDAVTASGRAGHRRGTIVRCGLAVGCSAALITAVALLPGPDTMVSRAAVATVLILTVLTAAAVARWRLTRASRAVSANPRELRPATDPVAAPVTAPGPATARSSS